MYFEAHVTIEPVFEERLEEVKLLSQAKGFKVATLLMQKRKEDTPELSKYDTFTTGHSTDYFDLEDRTYNLVTSLQNSKFKVLRYKIEECMLDSRIEDKWGLV